MLKNNEPRQACKDPFIYTESLHYSVWAAYTRTDLQLQAAQRGCRDERTARPVGQVVALLPCIQCMHTVRAHVQYMRVQKPTFNACT